MKKIMSKLMVGAVALAVIAPTASFAAADAVNTTGQNAKHRAVFGMKHLTAEQRQENQEQLMELIKKYTPELAEQFQALFDRQEEMKAKVDEIREQVKAGTLTEEEAQAKLKEMGIEFHSRGFGGKKLDEETRAKVEEIREQVKAGTLTEEEAQAKLKELGIEFHSRGSKNLNVQLKEAVEAQDEAKIKEILTKLLTHMQERGQND